MSFQSAGYAVFLAAVFAGHWALARSRLARPALLLGASYFFYACWSPWYLLVLLAYTVVGHAAARAIAAQPVERRARRRALTAGALGALVGVLALFKGLELLQGTTLAWLGWQPPAGALLLPLGLSFYSFQVIGYLLDVQRGTLAPAARWIDFALFVAFFPQLLAGPLQRGAGFLPQLAEPARLSRRDLHAGLWRIQVGLFKKALIADVLARGLVDAAYAPGSAVQGLWMALAVYGTCLQLYADFSGYCDIAIGSALLLGLRLPENFAAPYRARSLIELWSRWHITLSAWVRDYVFVPLSGGAKRGVRVYASLWLSLFVMGLWHGARINMALWGALHGALLVVNHLWARSGLGLFRSRLGSLAAWFLTFHSGAALLVLFRTEDLAHAGDVFQRLAAPTAGPAPGLGLGLAFLAGVATHACPDRWQLALRERFCTLPSLVVGLLLPVSFGLLAASGQRGLPFLYFQF